MATTFQSLGLDKLSQNEKIALIDELWDDLDNLEAPTHSLSEAQLNELQRRMAEAAAGNIAWIPLEDVRAEIERRYGA